MHEFALAQAEQLVDFADLLFDAACVNTKKRPMHYGARGVAEAIVKRAIIGAAGAYGFAAVVAIEAKRGDRARVARQAAAAGAFEALGGQVDPKRVAYAFGLDAHAATRPRVCSATFGQAADAARAMVLASISELRL